MTADRVIATAAETLAVVLLLPLAAAAAASGGYAEWWGTARGWSILADSLAFSAAAATVAIAVAFVVARAGLAWAAVACIPLLLPSSLLGSAWILLLGRNGPLGAWVTVYDWPVAAAVVGLRYAGVGAIILALHRRRGDDAARVFPVRRAWWWLDVLPALRPAVVAWLAMLILAGADHIMPSVFLIQTYGTQILIQYNALFDLAGAVALAMPMLAVAAVALVVAGRLADWRGATPPRATRVRASRPAIALAVALTAAPLAAIAWRVDSTSILVEAVGGMREEVMRTLALAAAAAVLSAGAGWLLAERWLDCRRRGRWTLTPFVALNLAIPGTLPALGVIDLADRLALGGSGPLLFASVTRFAPVAMLVLFAAGLRRSALPAIAARLHGVSAASRLRHVQWPVYRRSLAVAALLCGLLVATELEMSVLLAAPGASTVGVRLYTLIHTAPEPLVAASALVACLVIAPLLALLALVITGGLNERTEPRMRERQSSRRPA